MIYGFPPIVDEQCRVLVLGSMPSVVSLERQQYYGHKQNYFWPMLFSLLEEPYSDDYSKKKDLLLRHHIALWDVLASCEIRGADDSSIRNPKANDLRRIFDAADITAVFATGKKAAALYDRFCRSTCGMDVICLPSTSPANCGCSYERLRMEYSRILEYL